MVTRFYFHAANSSVGGTLPSTEQNNALSPTRNVDPQSTNRTMDTTIGILAAHTSLTHATIAATTTTTYYFSRFVSEPLAAQTITSGTWTLNFANSESNAAANFPVAAANTAIPITCYVWNPSGGSKRGEILNGTSAATFSEAGTSSTVNGGTFSGAALAIQEGDVLCFEFIFTLTQGTTTSRNIAIQFDGDTVNTTDGTTVTRHASFLEHPGTINIYTPPAAIQMTSHSTKNLNTKFIT